MKKLYVAVLWEQVDEDGMNFHTMVEESEMGRNLVCDFSPHDEDESEGWVLGSICVFDNKEEAEETVKEWEAEFTEWEEDK